MSAVETIKKVLSSSLLDEDLVTIPGQGAEANEIAAAEEALGRTLSVQYKAMLSEWNGLDLEEIRLYGCGKTDELIGNLAAQQLPEESGVPPGLVVIGSDPSGFVFLEAEDGGVWQLDTDGGELKQVSSDFDQFISRYVFGPDAHNFSGEEWLEELKSAGLIE